MEIPYTQVNMLIFKTARKYVLNNEDKIDHTPKTDASLVAQVHDSTLVSIIIAPPIQPHLHFV